METVTLRAQPRPRGTKGSLKTLRRQKMLPAVVYGKEAGNFLVQVSAQAMSNILAHHSSGGTLINLELSNGEEEAPKSYLVMIREVQYDPLRRELLHIDFYQILLTEEIQTAIPVHLVGEAPGVKQGGILQHMLREVTVSCLPAQLPERIDADISDLGIGAQLTVADLQLPPGVTILDAPESVIALIISPALEVPEEEEAAEAAEEVEVASEAGEA